MTALSLGARRVTGGKRKRLTKRERNWASLGEASSPLRHAALAKQPGQSGVPSGRRTACCCSEATAGREEFLR